VTDGEKKSPAYVQNLFHIPQIIFVLLIHLPYVFFSLILSLFHIRVTVAQGYIDQWLPDGSGYPAEACAFDLWRSSSVQPELQLSYARQFTAPPFFY
jgi:hypothetical protein